MDEITSDYHKKSTRLEFLFNDSDDALSQIRVGFPLKGVVHPQNDFLSIDYSCLGQMSSIVFFCICRIPKTEKLLNSGV